MSRNSPFKPQRFGHYFLLDLLGKGGVAEVFLSTLYEHEHIPSEPPFFAIKRLLPKYSSNRSFVKKLSDEAKVSAILTHPYIVEMRDLGVIGTNFVLEMEWVHGKNLAQVFQKLKNQKQWFHVDAFYYVIRCVAKALQFAHQATDSLGRPLDIIHCDITPQNILLSYEGDVKLSDFGLVTAETKSRQVFHERLVQGKLHYLSPEQIQKQSLTQRTDIYSLGVLLYEGLFSKRPFSAKTAMGLQEKILHSQVKLNFPDIIPNAVCDVLGRSLRKDPEQRPSSVIEILEALPQVDAYKQKESVKTLLDQIFSKEKEKEKAQRERGLLNLRKERYADLSLMQAPDASVLSEKEHIDETSHFIPSLESKTEVHDYGEKSPFLEMETSFRKEPSPSSEKRNSRVQEFLHGFHKFIDLEKWHSRLEPLALFIRKVLNSQTWRPLFKQLVSILHKISKSVNSNPRIQRFVQTFQDPEVLVLSLILWIILILLLLL